MIGTIDWAGFALAVLLVEMTPGPNMAWLAALSVAHGRRAGLTAAAGVAVGLAINASVAAAGLAALAAGNAVIWDGLRYAGTAMMLWLAWAAWRDADAASPAQQPHAATGGRHFWAGLATNVLNPKAFLFYAVVLPQFLPRGGGWPDAAGLVLIAVSVATAIHLIIIAASAQVARWLDQPARLRRVRQGLALSLVGVAIWLFISSAPGA